MFTVNSYQKVTSVVYMLAPGPSIPNECSFQCSNKNDHFNIVTIQTASKLFKSAVF